MTQEHKSFNISALPHTLSVLIIGIFSGIGIWELFGKEPFLSKTLSILIHVATLLIMLLVIAYVTHRVLRRNLISRSTQFCEIVYDGIAEKKPKDYWFGEVKALLRMTSSAIFTYFGFCSLFVLILAILTNLMLIGQFTVGRQQVDRLDTQNERLNHQNELIRIQQQTETQRVETEQQMIEAQRKYDEIISLLADRRSIGNQRYALEAIPAAMIMPVQIIDQDALSLQPSQENNNNQDRISTRIVYPNLSPLRNRLLVFLKEEKSLIPIYSDRSNSVSSVLLNILHILGVKHRFPENEAKSLWQIADMEPTETTRYLTSGQRHDLLQWFNEQIWSGVQSKDLDLDHVADYFRGAKLPQCTLRNNKSLPAKIDLSFIDLRDADLSGADLSKAVLFHADLRGADLRCAILGGAKLRHADLSPVKLGPEDREKTVDLTCADLRSADLREAQLKSANLERADMTVADLRGARHHNIKVGCTIVTNAKVDIDPFAAYDFPEVIRNESEHEFLEQCTECKCKQQPE